jgi:predicted O-methyltransferase YrrM
MKRAGEQDITRHPDLDRLEGYLWRREGARLAYLAGRVTEGVIVEIGSNRGKSSCYLARGSKAGSKAKVYCVDLWDMGGQGEYQHLGFDLPATLQKFREQITESKVKSMIVEVKGDSVQIGKEWDKPVGLLFIDGDHRYEAVKADLEAWLPHVVPGGTIAFHDYTKPFPKREQFPGVIKFVREWLKKTGHKATRTGRVVDVQI